MIKVDDVLFPSLLVQTLSRGFEIKEGSNSGYVLDGTHRRDVTGMYLTYTITLDSSFADLPEYDRFFEILSDVAESHTIEFPYGQDVLTFEAEITDGEDSLILHEDDYNLWQDFAFTFRSRRPIKRPITSIDREMIAIPEYSGELVYNGESQTPTFSGYDPEKMFISGETSATDAGTYIAKFTPTIYYKWSDGEIGAKEVPWTIEKAELPLYIRPETVKLTRPMPSDIITATYEGDGVVSAKSDNVGVCDVESVEGNTVRVTSDMSKSGDANIIITVSEGTNYKSGEATCAVSVDNLKQPCNLRLSPTSVSLKGENNTAYVTVTRDGDGEIVVEPDTTGVCNFSLDGDVITVTAGTETGEVNIIVKCLEGTDWLSEQASLYVSSGLHEWGFRIDRKNDNPESALTYMGDAVGITPGRESWDNIPPFSNIRPCILVNGEVREYLKKEDITVSVDGNAYPGAGYGLDYMVEIPRIGVKIEPTDEYIDIWLTDMKNADGYHYYAHSLYEEGDCDYIYYACFLGRTRDGKLYSSIGVTPEEISSISTARSAAAARGEGYQQVSSFVLLLMQLLYLLKYKNRNCKVTIGAGYSGHQDSSSMTGGTVKNGPDSSQAMWYSQNCFLNIEDIWGNLFQYLDGIRIDSDYIIHTDFSGFNDLGEGYRFENKNPEFFGNVSGYLTDVFINNEIGFMPLKFGGSDTTFFACRSARLVGEGLTFGASYSSSLGEYTFFSLSSGSETGARLIYKHKEVTT